jgi:hypothetical protein
LLVPEFVAFHENRPPCRYTGISATNGVFRQSLVCQGVAQAMPDDG